MVAGNYKLIPTMQVNGGNHQICPFVFSIKFQQLSFQMSKFGGHTLKEQINLYFYTQIKIQKIIKCVDGAREGIVSIRSQSCMNK